MPLVGLFRCLKLVAVLPLETGTMDTNLLNPLLIPFLHLVQHIARLMSPTDFHPLTSSRDAAPPPHPTPLLLH
jgi:hypothetical protein